MFSSYSESGYIELLSEILKESKISAKVLLSSKLDWVSSHSGILINCEAGQHYYNIRDASLIGV